jgi:sortase A
VFSWRPEKKGQVRRILNKVVDVMSLALVGAGMLLISTFFFGGWFLPAGGTAGNPVTRTVEAQNQKFDLPAATGKERPVGPENPVIAGRGAGKGSPAGKRAAISGPKDRSLRITVPAMRRVRDSEIPTTVGNDEVALRNSVAIHLEGTGYPWQKGANVYIAGHRIGYPNTGSFLAFWDLNRLGKGDAVFLTDSTGKRYRYRVFRVFLVDPTDVHVTQPVKGKSIVTLQTCTWPDYSQRIIVQAEKVGA